MKMGSLVQDYTHVLLLFAASASVFWFIIPCMATTDTDVAVQLSDDVLGLIVFKSDITHDPFSHLSSWNEDDASPCSWRFIQCNPATSRVTGIFLDGLNLSGKIGLGLQKLHHLKVLSLSDNNFHMINPNLVLPPTLHTLNLRRNALSGHLPPSLINISSILSLDLSHNSLSGQIPNEYLSGCSSRLRFLSLSANMLDGPLPTTLSSCSLLNTLNLSQNHLSGNPSYEIFTSLHRLRVLDLSGNQLTGPLPRGISNLHFLKHLLLRNNRFSGPIPSDIGLCPHLTILDLTNNRFTGPLPESLKMLTSLSLFSVSNNFLSGDFPEWIGNMSSLKTVDFSDNGLLRGSIPASIAYCSSLSVIKLRGNNLSGDIPKDFFNLALEEVDFSHNGFTGLIPSGSSSSLRLLDLSKNNLTGNIPAAEKGLFSNLNYLNLSWNNLHSKMPSEIGHFKNLSVVDLRNSGIYGSIPSDICDSGSLRILQLDLNSLTGIIPQQIGNCSSLYLLSLSYNKLAGQIPGSISMLGELKILKLEHNELIGEIPQSLGILQNLLVVNISYNRLVGRLPNGGIFPSLDRTDLEGNLGICSPLLTGPCQLDVPKPLVLDPNSIPNQGLNRRRHGDSNSTSSQHMFLSVSAIVAISAAVMISCGVILITVLNASARRRIPFVDAALESIRSMSSSRSSAGTNLPLGKFISLDTKSSIPFFDNPHSLINKASELGEGAFGTMYKVLLGEQGRDDVAIKRLFTSTLTQCHEDFDREVRVLGKARHPNLVALKGYYWTPELQLLVTEFVPNGSLQSRLHERLASPLSWAIRLKIVLGTAKGLAHLHHSFRPPIIHYNIKPSNILVDESYNAKVSDFGLARLLTKQFQSTPGYVAPELACQSLRVNEKCDVYSFGMLILEIVTGRRPVEYGEDNVMILNDHVRVLLEEGNVLECVDPSMEEYLEDEVLPVLKLALVCTSQVPSSRPSMVEVVQILQVINTPVPQRMQLF